MELLDINSIISFNDEISNRINLFDTNNLETALLLYKPGQITVEHSHSNLDEIFYVISGTGTIIINDKKVAFKQNDIIFSPHNEKHGFVNTSDTNWVVLQIKLNL